jgi:hypothetical protein
MEVKNMDCELVFWGVCLGLALLFLLFLPFINNYLNNKDIERMFKNREFEEYHDDMEEQE